MLQNPLLRGGLTLFFFQYLLQAGLFFVVPLFLSVALGLSAIDDRRPSAPPLDHPAARCRRRAKVVPERLARAGSCALGSWSPVRRHCCPDCALEVGAGPEIVTGPLLLAGLGIGALASQLGSVTVSAVPDEQSGEVGGLQNTVTNLGASIGTALAGAVLIASSDHLVLCRNPGQSRRARLGLLASAGRARQRNSLHLRRRPRPSARRRRRSGRHR